jgi:hypothetical protein
MTNANEREMPTGTCASGSESGLEQPRPSHVRPDAFDPILIAEGYTDAMERQSPRCSDPSYVWGWLAGTADRTPVTPPLR